MRLGFSVPMTFTVFDAIGRFAPWVYSILSTSLVCTTTMIFHGTFRSTTYLFLRFPFHVKPLALGSASPPSTTTPFYDHACSRSGFALTWLDTKEYPWHEFWRDKHIVASRILPEKLSMEFYRIEWTAVRIFQDALFLVVSKACFRGGIWLNNIFWIIFSGLCAIVE